MHMRKALTCLMLSLVLSLAIAETPQGQRQPSTTRIKALVGGTLIDGFGGRPVRNSVILIDGERITAVGVQGTLAIPAGAEVISTEGMSVLPGLWDMHVHLMLNGHSDYAHWDKTYPAQLGPVIMPACAKQLLLAGVTSARDLGRAARCVDRGAQQDQQRSDSRARRCICRDRSSSTSRIRAPRCSAGASVAPPMRAPRSRSSPTAASTSSS